MEFPNSDAELAALVDEVAEELMAISKSEAPLAKNEGSSSASASASSMEKDEDHSESSGSPSPAESSGGSEGGPPPAEMSGESMPPTPSADPAADPSMAAPPSPSADPAAGADQAPSVEEIEALYEQLPPDQLEMHEMALQMAKQKMMGSAPGAPPPSAPPQMPPSAAPSAPPEMAMKHEAKIKELETKLAKAVKDNEETNLKIVTVLEKFAGEPMTKAVNGINYFKRPELAPAPPSSLKKSAQEMSKTEIKDRLNEVVRSPKLSKAERELINDYFFKPDQVSLDKLERLFERVQ